MISFAYLPEDLCGAVEGDKNTTPLISFLISSSDRRDSVIQAQKLPPIIKIPLLLSYHELDFINSKTDLTSFSTMFSIAVS